MARNTRGKHPQWLAKLKFQRHRALCKFRNVEFKFSFEEWYQWWLDNGVDKNVEANWNGSDRLCMLRFEDKGAVEPGNVYVTTIGETVSQNHVNGRWKPKRKTYIYDGVPMTIFEIREKIGTIVSPEYFHKDYIDKFKDTEFRILSNKYSRLPKSVKMPKYWEGHPDKWHTSEKAAFEELGISRGRYQYLQDQGYKRTKTEVGLTLEQYIRQHTRYPDPRLV